MVARRRNPHVWCACLAGPVLFTTVWATTPVVSVVMDFVQGHEMKSSQEQVAGCVIVLAGIALSFFDSK